MQMIAVKAPGMKRAQWLTLDADGAGQTASRLCGSHWQDDRDLTDTLVWLRATYPDYTFEVRQTPTDTEGDTE